MPPLGIYRKWRGFNPGSAGPLALEFLAGVGITNVSGSASAWANMVTGGPSAAQASSANRPLIVANQLNGFPILRGTRAAGTFMQILAGCPGGNQAHTIFVVGKFDSLPSVVGGLVGYGFSGGTKSPSIVGITNTNTVCYADNSTLTPNGGTADTSFHVFSKTFDGTTIKGFVDGVQVATATGVTYALGTSVSIGAVSGSSPTDSDIADVYVYTSALGAAAYAYVNEGLGQKFALVEP